MSGANGIGGNLVPSQQQNQPAPPNGDHGDGGSGAEQNGSQTNAWASDPWQNPNLLQSYQPTPHNYQGLIASQYAGNYGLGGYGGAYGGPGSYPPGGLIPGAGGQGQGGQNNGLAGAYSAYAPTFSSLPISPLEYWQSKYEHKVGRSEGTFQGGLGFGAAGVAVGGGLGYGASRLFGIASHFPRVGGIITGLAALAGGFIGATKGADFGGFLGESQSVIADTNDDGRSNGSTAHEELYPYARQYNPNNVNLAY